MTVVCTIPYSTFEFLAEMINALQNYKFAKLILVETG